MREQIEKALQTIKNHFGTAIFANPGQFKAALADTPIKSDADTARNLLRIAVCDIQAYSRLETALANNNLFIVDDLTAEMSSKYMMDKTAVQMVIECIAELLGYTSKSAPQPKSQKPTQNATAQQNPQAQPAFSAADDPLLKRVFMFLEDGEWGKADEYCERILDADPENARAYVGKLCAELKIKDEANLANHKQPLDDMPNYKKVLRFADTNYRTKVVGYNHAIIERISKEKERQRKQLKVGSIISFAKYNWRVLDVQGDKVLLLTEDVIEKRQYNMQPTYITWEACALRKYLNGEFLQKFTREEQSRIIETRASNPDNLWYGTHGGKATNDKIFLLSLEEVDRYFGNSGDYQGKRRKEYNGGKLVVDSKGFLFSNAHDNARVAKYKGEACRWWLRSPGSSSDCAAGVDDDGYVSVIGIKAYDIFGDIGINVLLNYGGGVRPALWLNL